MTKTFRNAAILALAVSLAGAMSFAQSDAVYKAKCLMCHGATGTPNPALVKAIGVKAASDPDVKKLTVPEIVKVIKSGSPSGKMKAVAGLSDADATAAATYFKTLAK
jgi:cytochrome c